MTEILNPYHDFGSFYFRRTDNLKEVCNAPSEKGGVYILYADINKKKEVIYIGSSGHIQNNGTMSIRKTGGGGLKGRIVNGHQFGKIKRFISWKTQMEFDNLKSLEIYWYVAHTSHQIHSPLYVEACLLQKYFDNYGRLPKWNKKF